MQLELSSRRMQRGATIDVRYIHHKSGGTNFSPAFAIDGIPDETRSLAVLFVDRDAGDFVHWAVIDLPPSTTALPDASSGTALPPGARELMNTAGTVGYYGPNPPAGSGPHRYELVVYALDIPHLDIAEKPDAAAFESAANRHAIATGSTHWLYENR